MKLTLNLHGGREMILSKSHLLLSKGITGRLASIVVAAAWLCSPSKAVCSATVDCSKTASKSEELICNSPELDWLDRQMAVRYRVSSAYNEALLKLLKKTDEEIDKERLRASQIQQSQEEWLRKRNACETDACLLDAYYTRLPELLRFGTAPVQEQKQVPKFKIVEGNGWTVCDAYAKFLNALPDTEPLPLFDLHLNKVPDMKEVPGEELDIQENLPLLYAVEQQFRGHKKWPPPSDFDEWKKNLEWRIKAGFKPRLRKIKAMIAKGLSIEQQKTLRIVGESGDIAQRIRDADATNAPLDTFLAYQEDVTSYQAQVKLYRSAAIGSLLLRFDEATGKLQKEGLPTIFVRPIYVVTFQGSPYLVSQFVGSDSSPGHQPYIGGNIRISRLQRRYEPESRDGSTHYLSEDFCRIVYQNPEFQKL